MGRDDDLRELDALIRRIFLVGENGETPEAVDRLLDSVLPWERSLLDRHPDYVRRELRRLQREQDAGGDT